MPLGALLCRFLRTAKKRQQSGRLVQMNGKQHTSFVWPGLAGVRQLEAVITPDFKMTLEFETSVKGLV